MAPEEALELVKRLRARVEELDRDSRFQEIERELAAELDARSR